MNNANSSVDDPIVQAVDWKTHLKLLEEIFRRLQQFDLTARPSKRVSGFQSDKYLGYHIGYDSIAVNKDNLEKIRTAGRPIMKKEVRSFWELANYHRIHIPLLAVVAGPLSNLTSK